MNKPFNLEDFKNGQKALTREGLVVTFVGITPIKSDDLIMRGVEGEEYPIGRDLFTRTYELI